MLGLAFLLWIAVMVVVFEVMTLRHLYDQRKRKQLREKFSEVVKDWTGHD